MANVCSFSMKVKGNRGDIEQFCKAMMQDGTVYMGRGADADIEFENENSASLQGWCKWSIQSALIDNAISMRTEPNRWFFGEGVNSEELEFITLFEACKRWNIVMEVYSEECGLQFQEHFLCDKGEIIYQECIEWEEYDVYDYETKQEAEDDIGVEFTDEEWANQDDGRITRGGFENWDFEI